MPSVSVTPVGLDPIALITRPEPAASRFAAELRALGWRAVAAPLMRIMPVAHDSAALYEARGLIFTSVHAVPSAGPGRGRPAFCVGPATADVARDAGFDVTQGPGDAVRLAPMLDGLGDGWLHPHGRHVTAGLPIPGMVVYDQQRCPLPGHARLLLDGPAALLLPLFSPRSARIAADALAEARAELLVAAISAAAAEAWAGPVADLAIAPTPDADGMLAALQSLRGRETSGAPAG